MCNFCSSLKKDKPFRFHRPDKKTRTVLVGANARKHIEKIENEIFPLAGNFSLMTAVIGQPGSGKTQILNHLKGIREEKNKICILLDLKDVKIDYEYLAKIIVHDSSLMEYLNLYGFNLKYEGSLKDQIGDLREFLHKVKSKNGVENCEICILVDAVDEYLRKITSKNENKEEKKLREIIVKDLIETMNELLSDLPYTCIVLAITRDVYSDFKSVLDKASHDLLLSKRFVFMSEDGKELNLNELNEDDTQEMVSTFLSSWAMRNNLELPNYPMTVLKNNSNVFPFTPEAINIFWNAGFVPGDVSLACLMALDRKLNSPEVNKKNPEHLIVTENDAAWIVTQFSNYFNYEKAGFKERLASLLKDKELEYRLEKISLEAQQTYFNYSESIVEAFEDFIVALGDDFHIEPGDRYKFTKSKYDIEEDFEVIDLVVTFKSVKIGLQFIFKENETELRRKTITLLSSLRDKQIGRGLTIQISKEEDDEFKCEVKNNFDLYKKIKKYSEGQGSGNNSINIIDYSTVINLIQISEANAWRILGLHLNKQSDEFENYVKHIDISINIKNSFTELVESKPKIVSKPTPHHSRGSLLYK